MAIQEKIPDSPFSIWVSILGVGLHHLLCGWLAASYGWHYGFGLAGIGMLTGLIFFWSGIKKNVFGDRGQPPSKEIYEMKVMGIPQKTLIPILAFAAAPLIAFILASYKSIAGGETLLGDQNYVELLFKLIGIAVVLSLGSIMYNSTVDERKKLFMAVLITFFMTLFWGFS